MHTVMAHVNMKTTAMEAFTVNIREHVEKSAIYLCKTVYVE